MNHHFSADLAELERAALEQAARHDKRDEDLLAENGRLRRNLWISYLIHGIVGYIVFVLLIAWLS